MAQCQRLKAVEAETNLVHKVHPPFSTASNTEANRVWGQGQADRDETEVKGVKFQHVREYSLLQQNQPRILDATDC